MTIILTLSIVGIILILAEMVLPGGVIGIAGIGCLIAAVVVTFTNFGPAAGMVALFALLVFCAVVFALWMKYFQRLPFTKQLVLQESIDEQSTDDGLNDLVGRQAVATTLLMPSGHIEIDDEKYDALSESGSIESGVGVKVVAVRGATLIVEAEA